MMLAHHRTFPVTGCTLVRRHAAAAKSHQLCPTLCNPIDGSPSGSRPWDSPGKNTRVGCHFLLQFMKVESENWKWSRSVMSDSSQPHGLQPISLLHPWDFPDKSTGVGCHCLLLLGGVIGYKQCLSKSHSVVSDSLQPHGLYSPWSSPGQNTGVGSFSLLQGIFPTQVSCIAGRFFTSLATREAPNSA